MAKRFGFKHASGDLATVSSYLALAHHWPNAHIDSMNFWHPDNSPMGQEFSRGSWSRDGSSIFCGHRKHLTNGGVMIKNRYAFESATGIETIKNENFWGSNFNNMLYWIMYNTDMETGYFLNYYYSFEGSDSPFCLKNDKVYGFHLMNKKLKNPHYQWFINRIMYPEGIMKFFQEEPLKLIELALWYDSNIPAIKPHDIPLGRFVPPGSTLSSIFRSGFNGKGDTWINVLLTDSGAGDGPGGATLGRTTIFREEFLGAGTMHGPFWRVPYGHSNLVFFDISTRDTKKFDFPIHPNFHAENCQYTWLTKYPKCVEGTVTAFESQNEYDYLGFHNEPTYYPDSVVKSWNCQMIYLRPGILIRFDKAVVTKAHIEPRFFLWMQGEQAKVNGNMVNSVVPDHVEDYDGNEFSFLGHLHRSKLHLKALLPHKKILRLAYGNLAELPSKSLVSKSLRVMHPPISSALPKGPNLDLMMKYQNRLLPGVRIKPAISRKAGNFSTRIMKSSKLKIIQTAAMINENINFRLTPTLSELTERLNMLGFASLVLANYEHWVEGNICLRRLLEEQQIPPAYSELGELDEKNRNQIIKNITGKRPDIRKPKASGHLEVRLPLDNQKKEHYFLNVISATDAEEKTMAVPVSKLVKENEESITIEIIYGSKKATIKFNKKNQKGKIKITQQNKVLWDQDLAEKIDVANQAFGSDFLTGKRK